MYMLETRKRAAKSRGYESKTIVARGMKVRNYIIYFISSIVIVG